MVVQVEGLGFKYGERTALDGVSLRVREREIFGVLGPNGGGKSTLFKVLSTMLAPSVGSAAVCGFDVDAQPAEVRRRIGVVFQSQSLDRKLTVIENLRAQGHLYGLHGARLTEKIRRSLARLGLDERRDELVGNLSGGLRQRTEIAKALLHSPSVLLMDEPSTGLDPGARRELWRYIEELRDREGVTILLTTHILDEADRCDRLALMHLGRIVAQGTPRDLKSRIGGDVVVLEVEDPEQARELIRSRFKLEATLHDGQVRVETGNGHRFIADVIEAFPGLVESVALHKPTLEDVFLDETGAKL